MIKAIIFDLGGVCFEIDWLKINEEMIKKFDMTTLVKSAGNEKAIQYYKEALEGKRPAKDMFQELNKKGYDIDEIIKFYKEMYKKYKNVNKKIYGLIKKLKEKIMVVCLTDTNSIHFEAHQEQGTTTDFNRVFASFQLGHIKRDINAFKKVLKEINLKPEEVIFIDDNEKNVENAKSLGINAIRYESYEKLVSQLNRLNLI